MTWIKVDDAFEADPKFAGATKHQIGVWLSGLAHCSRYGTDGFIGEQFLSAIGPKAARDELCSRGLWQPVGRGSVVVVGYLDHQMARARQEHERAKWRNSKRKSRLSAVDKSGHVHPCPLDVRAQEEEVEEEEEKTLSQSVTSQPGSSIEAIERAFFTACFEEQANAGEQISDLTNREAGLLRAAARQIAGAGGTPDNVHQRVGEARRSWSSAATVSPRAIAANWSALGHPSPGAPPADEPMPARTTYPTYERPPQTDEDRQASLAQIHQIRDQRFKAKEDPQRGEGATG